MGALALRQVHRLLHPDAVHAIAGVLGNGATGSVGSWILCWTSLALPAIRT